jgi:hypothetical protein
VQGTTKEKPSTACLALKVRMMRSSSSEESRVFRFLPSLTLVPRGLRIEADEDGTQDVREEIRPRIPALILQRQMGISQACEAEDRRDLHPAVFAGLPDTSTIRPRRIEAVKIRLPGFRDILRAEPPGPQRDSLRMGS